MRPAGLGTRPTKHAWAISPANQILYDGTDIMHRLTLASIVTFALWGQECTFRANPDAFLDRQTRAARQVFERTNVAIARASRPGGGRKYDAVPASTLPPRSFIDEEVFGTLAAKNVPAAAMSTDEEFIRRVTLDLTGKLPTPTEIRVFVASDSATKNSKFSSAAPLSPSGGDSAAKTDKGQRRQNAATVVNAGSQTTLD